MMMLIGCYLCERPEEMKINHSSKKHIQKSLWRQTHLKCNFKKKKNSVVIKIILVCMCTNYIFFETFIFRILNEKIYIYIPTQLSIKYKPTQVGLCHDLVFFLLFYSFLRGLKNKSRKIILKNL